jgi:hypothetical protein
MYRYRCDQCATTSPPVGTRVELTHERDRHRRQAHGGHIPDGERLQRATRPPVDRTALIALAAVALLLLTALLFGH